MKWLGGGVWKRNQCVVIEDEEVMNFVVWTKDYTRGFPASSTWQIHEFICSRLEVVTTTLHHEFLSSFVALEFPILSNLLVGTDGLQCLGWQRNVATQCFPSSILSVDCFMFVELIMMVSLMKIMSSSFYITATSTKLVQIYSVCQAPDRDLRFKFLPPVSVYISHIGTLIILDQFAMHVSSSINTMLKKKNFIINYANKVKSGWIECCF